MLVLFSISALGVESTSGDKGTPVRRGPYGFSRNPQYLGFITGLIGWALMANSLVAFIVSIVGIVPLVLVPLAKGPWLLARHRSTYAEYKRTVPRFVSLRK